MEKNVKMQNKIKIKWNNEERIPTPDTKNEKRA